MGSVCLSLCVFLSVAVLHVYMFMYFVSVCLRDFVSFGPLVSEMMWTCNIHQSCIILSKINNQNVILSRHYPSVILLCRGRPLMYICLSICIYLHHSLYLSPKLNKQHAFAHWYKYTHCFQIHITFVFRVMTSQWSHHVITMILKTLMCLCGPLWGFSFSSCDLQKHLSNFIFLLAFIMVLWS